MGSHSAIESTRPGGEGFDRDLFREEILRTSDGRPLRAEDAPMTRQVALPEILAQETQRRRFGDEKPLDSFAPGFQAAFADQAAAPRTKPSWASLAALGLGIFGLYELGTELVRAFSPVFIVGASFFFGGKKSVPEIRGMGIAFAWLDRLQIFFSEGPEKVNRLQLLGRRLEDAGYLPEARERYQAAMNLAMQNLARLTPRNPENRVQAGEAQRAVGAALLDLARFWDRHSETLEWGALELYQKALKYLESLGEKSIADILSINTAKLRLQAFYFDTAERLEGRGDFQLAGEHYELAAETSLSPLLRLELLGLALKVYSQAIPPNPLSIGRVMEKMSETTP